MERIKKFFCLVSYKITLFVILTTLTLTLTAQAKSPECIRILKDKAFLEKFNHYHDGLKELKLNIALWQLNHVVEDIIMYSDDNGLRSGIDYRVGFFKKAFFLKLKETLCRTNNVKHNYATEYYKEIILDCLLEVRNKQNLTIKDPDCGSVTGIVIQVIDKVSIKKFCESEDFEKL